MHCGSDTCYIRCSSLSRHYGQSMQAARITKVRNAAAGRCNCMHACMHIPAEGGASAGRRRYAASRHSHAQQSLSISTAASATSAACSEGGGGSSSSSPPIAPAATAAAAPPTFARWPRCRTSSSSILFPASSTSPVHTYVLFWAVKCSNMAASAPGRLLPRHPLC